MENKEYKIVGLPSIKDPRWYLLSFLGVFISIVMNLPNFTQHLYQLVILIGSAIVLDFLILVFFKRIIMFPLSSMISCLGPFLFCEVSYDFVYVIMGALIVFSKHIVSYSNKHIFNPNNFAIVFSVLLFSEYATTVAGRWGESGYFLSLIYFLGIGVALYAKRINLVISYVLFFIFFSYIQSAMVNVNFEQLLFPMKGFSFALFIFYMITDPKTSPNNTKKQILFGITIALIEVIFRYLSYKSAPFFSLFLTILIWFYIDEYRSKRLLNHKKIVD